MKTLIKLGLSVLATAVAFIPFWIVHIAKWFLSPEGFWQKFVNSNGIWLLCGIQLILLIAWIMCLFAIWTTDSYIQEY